MTSDGPEVEAIAKDENGGLRFALVEGFKLDEFGEGTNAILELDTDSLEIVTLISATDGEIN
jgi:hypothetical protein